MNVTGEKATKTEEGTVLEELRQGQEEIIRLLHRLDVPPNKRLLLVLQCFETENDIFKKHNQDLAELVHGVKLALTETALWEMLEEYRSRELEKRRTKGRLGYDVQTKPRKP